MSAGVATLLKILGAAAIIALVVITITGQLDNVIVGTISWFKGKIGMSGSTEYIEYMKYSLNGLV